MIELINPVPYLFVNPDLKSNFLFQPLIEFAERFLDQNPYFHKNESYRTVYADPQQHYHREISSSMMYCALAERRIFVISSFSLQSF